MPSHNLRVTFRELPPDEALVSLAHRCVADMHARGPLALLLGAHRDGCCVQLRALDSGVIVSDSGADAFLAVRNVFARWKALLAELDQYKGMVRASAMPFAPHFQGASVCSRRAMRD
jgi:hypothetical protein